MLRVVICDDDYVVCEELESRLCSILSVGKVAFKIDIYYSGESFLRHYKANPNVDLLFLDIELGDTIGVSIGEVIRDEYRDEKTQIVYISSQPSYALSLFKTRPLDFLIKPVTTQQLTDIINVFFKLRIHDNKMFEYSVKKRLYCIAYENIMYFESCEKKVFIHRVKGEDIHFYGRLDQVNEETDERFMFIHKSYIVNYTKIKTLAYDHVVLIDGTRLPISQSRRQQMRQLQMLLRKQHNG